jgi:DNA-binding MarR family transcriptional regulator
MRSDWSAPPRRFRRLSRRIKQEQRFRRQIGRRSRLSRYDRPMENDRLVTALEGLVVGAVGLTTAALDSFAPDMDLPLQQWRALVVIARGDGIRTGELAVRLGLTPPSASRLVQRLERRGLVSTERDESDRRATVVRATAAGTQLWSTLVDHRRQLIARVLAELPRPLPAAIVGDIEALQAAFAQYA